MENIALMSTSAKLTMVDAVRTLWSHARISLLASHVQHVQRAMKAMGDTVEKILFVQVKMEAARH